MESATPHAGSGGATECLVEYDVTEGEAITGAVVDAVAAVAEADPIELPPLYESIDPDALETLFDRQREGTALEISFSYTGYEIVVEEGDRITVSAVAEST